MNSSLLKQFVFTQILGNMQNMDRFCLDIILKNIIKIYKHAKSIQLDFFPLLSLSTLGLSPDHHKQ